MLDIRADALSVNRLKPPGQRIAGVFRLSRCLADMSKGVSKPSISSWMLISLRPAITHLLLSDNDLNLVNFGVYLTCYCSFCRNQPALLNR
jgi:hypothetical protein